MSWSEAQARAEPLLDWILRERAEIGAPRAGDVVLLGDFEDEAGYLFINGQDDGTLTFHRMKLKAIERALRPRGLIVRKIRLALRGYFDWLASRNRTDSAETRAEYLIEQYDPH